MAGVFCEVICNTYNIDPLLESADEPDLGHLHASFAAAATAEKVVAGADKPPAAVALLLFLGNKDFVDVREIFQVNASLASIALVRVPALSSFGDLEGFGRVWNRSRGSW